MSDKTDTFFGNDEVVTSDLPRYSINDGESGNSLENIQGVYEDSVTQMIEGKQRLLHQIKPSEPINGSQRVLLWGGYKLDSTLPTLVPGTKVRITYKGMTKGTGGRQLKDILIEFSAKAVRRANPFSTEETPF